MSGVRIELSEGVLSLTFARPDKKNAITDAMYATLSEGLDRARADPAVRAVMIDGEGGTFTAGNDLADFAAQNAGGSRGEPSVLGFLRSLTRLDKPLVAGVEGRAVGVGFTMLLHCDLVYVARDARMSVPFVDLAVSPEAGSSLLLPARIGHARAYAMFALGQVVDGPTAVEWGLANEAVEPGSASARARQAAQALAAKPVESLAVTKRLMRDRTGLAARIEEESGHFSALLLKDDAREAFAAFFERRPPNFTRPA